MVCLGLCFVCWMELFVFWGGSSGGGSLFGLRVFLVGWGFDGFVCGFFLG